MVQSATPTMESWSWTPPGVRNVLLTPFHIGMADLPGPHARTPVLEVRRDSRTLYRHNFYYFQLTSQLYQVGVCGNFLLTIIKFLLKYWENYHSLIRRGGSPGHCWNSRQFCCQPCSRPGRTGTDRSCRSCRDDGHGNDGMQNARSSIVIKTIIVSITGDCMQNGMQIIKFR